MWQHILETSLKKGCGEGTSTVAEVGVGFDNSKVIALREPNTCELESFSILLGLLRKKNSIFLHLNSSTERNNQETM